MGASPLAKESKPGNERNTQRGTSSGASSPTGSRKAASINLSEGISVGSSRSGVGGKNYLKNVIFKKNLASERKLTWLRVLFMISFLSVSVIGIVEHLQFNDQLSAIVDSLTQSTKVQDAVKSVVKVIESARLIELSYDPKIQELLPHILVRNDSLETMEKELLGLDMVKSTVANRAAWLKKTGIDASQSDDDWEDTEHVIEYVSLFINAGNSFWNLSKSSNDSKPTSPDFSTNLHTLTTSGIGIDLEKLLNKTGYAAKDTFKGLMISSGNPTMTRAAIGPIIFLIVFLFGIRPVYTSIEAYRDQFLTLFLDIPKEVIRGIYESNQQRLLSSEENESDDDNDSVIGQPMDNLDFISSNTSEVPARVRQSNTLSGFFLAYFDLLGDRYYLNAKWLSVFGLSILYFFSAGITLYLWFDQYAETSAYWAEQRQVYAMQIKDALLENFMTYLNYTIEGRPEDKPHPLWDINDSMRDFLYFEDSMLYGNPILKLQAALDDPASDQARLLIVNACNYTGASTTTVDRMGETCSTFGNGVMSRGLHSGIKWFVETSAELDHVFSNRSLWNKDPDYRKALIHQMSQIWMQCEFHFEEPMTESIRLYVQPLELSAKSFELFHLITTAIFVPLLVLFYGFIIHPMIRALSQDIQRASMMLFMIPPELLVNVESIMKWAAAKDGFFSSFKEEKKDKKDEKKGRKEIEGSAATSRQSKPMTEEDEPPMKVLGAGGEEKVRFQKWGNGGSSRTNFI